MHGLVGFFYCLDGSEIKKHPREMWVPWAPPFSLLPIYSPASFPTLSRLLYLGFNLPSLILSFHRFPSPSSLSFSIVGFFKLCSRNGADGYGVSNGCLCFISPLDILSFVSAGRCWRWEMMVSLSFLSLFSSTLLSSFDWIWAFFLGVLVSWWLI